MCKVRRRWHRTAPDVDPELAQIQHAPCVYRHHLLLCGDSRKALDRYVRVMRVMSSMKQMSAISDPAAVPKSWWPIKEPKIPPRRATAPHPSSATQARQSRNALRP